MQNHLELNTDEGNDLIPASSMGSLNSNKKLLVQISEKENLIEQ